ncbi:uncharacterized protein LOC103312333 isoform X1 [Tribolium castaneum]|uniref:uncharacterized protein LOC103312333 isoform X1 n=1 Tax=Tribolium castaneum TaxID=7070 RepID=UPI0030FE8B44
MDPHLANEVIEIEDDIIDLDDVEKTPEEIIYEWDAKIRKKLTMFSVVDNEIVLGDIMKEYLESFQEMASSYEEYETLKNKAFHHISCLYLYYVELQCCAPDNYLSNMEDILTLYCNLELEIIRPLKRKERQIESVSKKMIHALTVYLLERQDHILHVLIKMNTTNLSKSCSALLNILYKHFLINVPALNLCDESFCRNYIVFQKWKKIQKFDDWKHMDEILYKRFKRTPESIKNNELLRQILMPACESTVEIVLSLFRSFRDVSDAYFKHVMAKKNLDLADIDFNIDLGEDEPSLPVHDENEEEVKFLKAYYEIERNMSSLSHMINSSDMEEVDIFRKCKKEFDEDDDVQFIGITMLPNGPIHHIDDDIPRMSNSNNNNETTPLVQIEEESPSVTTPPSLQEPVVEETLETSTLENVNEISPICVGSPRTVSESSISCPTSDIAETPTEELPAPVLPLIKEVISSASEIPEETQPKVPLVSNDTQTPSPSSPQSSDPVCENNIQRTVEMKSVEVQADVISNSVYNDYGLTTPPFDVPLDDQGAVEPRLYADIGQKKDSENIFEKIAVTTRTIDVQVDPPSSESCSYNDYGLTPPNDTPLDDHTRLQKTCLYANIRQDDKDLGEEKGAHEIDHSKENLDSEFEDFENQLGITEIPNIDSEEIDIESYKDDQQDNNQFKIRVNLDLQIPEDSSSKTSDQIDTGQEIVPNTAPNIEPSVTAESSKEIFNGNTVLKPLLSPNRTNGQTKDVPIPPKIVFTSSQKLRAAPLDDFSRFESAMHVRWSQDILSGPVTKAVPTKPQDKLDFFQDSKPVASASSRSSSPTEMTSPPYEAIDDFRGYYSASVNGRVRPSPPEPKVPKGILKRPQVRRPVAECVLVPKRVRRDPKLNMTPQVAIERLSFIENKIKKTVNNTRTLRVDYDKTTPHINEKDVVRCISPPRFSWIVDLAPSKQHPGKVKPVDAYCRKVSSKCEKNQSSCCNQLAEEFTKLNCNVEDKALNLTIPDIPVDPESEFSNSPTLLQGKDELLQHCLEETSIETPEVSNAKSLLCDNSNFYTSQTINDSNCNNRDLENTELKKQSVDETIKLPTAVPDSYDFDKTFKNEVFLKIDWQNLNDSDGETRLPLKKRKLSVAEKNEEEKKEEISYPATPMISIAELEALHPRKLPTNSTRPFKTPAERKEMPPLPVFCNVDSETSPIVTGQFNINNHTYHNPTINYHMNNVPVPFINVPCGSYYSIPPILVPFNNVSNFDQAKQQETTVKKETRKQGRQRRRH